MFSFPGKRKDSASTMAGVRRKIRTKKIILNRVITFPYGTIA
jgi:hypothetical protein